MKKIILYLLILLVSTLFVFSFARQITIFDTADEHKLYGITVNKSKSESIDVEYMPTPTPLERQLDLCDVVEQNGLSKNQASASDTNEKNIPFAICEINHNNLPDYSISKTLSINTNIEYPTHEIKLEMWQLPEHSKDDSLGYQYDVVITIHNIQRNSSEIEPSIQVIREIKAGYGSGRWININPENPLNLHFIDFNGDGYLDMALRQLPPQTSGMADDPHYFWLYDPDRPYDNFQRNYSLEYAAHLGQITSVDDGHVRIFEYHGVMYQDIALYKYDDGEFSLVEYETMGCNN